MCFTVIDLFFSSVLALDTQTHENSLVERKEQWRRDEEERKRNAPDPTVPAGHTLMPESERQETLESLKQSMNNS